jgi:hypothetical protein
MLIRSLVVLCNYAQYLLFSFSNPVLLITSAKYDTILYSQSPQLNRVAGQAVD